MLAAVGPMQFEVAVHRLENEFGAPVELSTDRLHGGPPHRRGVGAGAAGDERRRRCCTRSDGALLALFESPTGSTASRATSPSWSWTASSPKVTSAAQH